MSLIKEIDYGTPESKSKNMVTLTIDGQSVTVPEGTSIMRAAMEIGTEIPKLCATDSIKAFGSCRLCLIEIEGRNGDAGLLHDAGHAGHYRAHANAASQGDPAGRDGALHLRPSARLSDLRRQRRLRIADTSRRGRAARGALRL